MLYFKVFRSISLTLTALFHGKRHILNKKKLSGEQILRSHSLNPQRGIQWLENLLEDACSRNFRWSNKRLVCFIKPETISVPRFYLNHTIWKGVLRQIESPMTKCTWRLHSSIYYCFQGECP